MKLVVVSPMNSHQLREVQRHLRQVENLRLVMVGGSTGEGAQIIVSADEPIPLVGVLRKMPITEQVVKKDKEIQITLSSTK